MPSQRSTQRKTSCVPCRTHREFCNRSLPCATCSRHRRECTYSAGTAPLSRSSAAPQDEFDAQISRLKDLVTRLGASQANPDDAKVYRYPKDIINRTNKNDTTSAASNSSSSSSSSSSSLDNMVLDFSYDLLGPISNLCFGATGQLTASAQHQLDLLTKLQSALPKNDTNSSDNDNNNNNNNRITDSTNSNSNINNNTLTDISSSMPGNAIDESALSPYSFFFSPASTPSPKASNVDLIGNSPMGGGSGSSDNSSSLIGNANVQLPSSTTQLMRFVPDLPVAKKFGQRYLDVLDFLHLLVRPQTWQTLLQQVYIDSNPPSPDRLSVFFAVLGLGAFLTNNPYDPQTALNFLRCAMQALVLHRFLSNPSVDVVRALAIINQYALYITDGTTILNDVVSFLPTAQGLAAQLNLHRDPLRLNINLSHQDIEDRRYIQWALLKQEFCTSALIGRTWLLSPPERYDVGFPDNDTLSNQNTGIMLNHRLRIASLAQTISIELFSAPNASTTYGKAMSFSRALIEAEETVSFLRPQYDSSGQLVPMKDEAMDLERAFTSAPTALINIRLHCALLAIPELTDSVKPYHRRAVINHARFLLAMHRSDMVSRRWSPVAMYMVVGALGLATAILLHPHGQDADDARQVLRSFLTGLTPASRASSILRRFHEAVRFLIDAANDVSNTPPTTTTATATTTAGSGNNAAVDNSSDFGSAHISNTSTPSATNPNFDLNSINTGNNNNNNALAVSGYLSGDSINEDLRLSTPEDNTVIADFFTGVPPPNVKQQLQQQQQQQPQQMQLNDNSNNNNTSDFIKVEDFLDVTPSSNELLLNNENANSLVTNGQANNNSNNNNNQFDWKLGDFPVPTFDWDPLASLGADDGSTSFPWFIPSNTEQ